MSQTPDEEIRSGGQRAAETPGDQDHPRELRSDDWSQHVFTWPMSSPRSGLSRTKASSPCVVRI